MFVIFTKKVNEKHRFYIKRYEILTINAKRYHFTYRFYEKELDPEQTFQILRISNQITVLILF